LNEIGVWGEGKVSSYLELVLAFEEAVEKLALEESHRDLGEIPEEVLVH
jgi:hypothetical protein